jgi:hypothetical protein
MRIVGSTKVYSTYSPATSAKTFLTTPAARAGMASYSSIRVAWTAVSGDLTSGVVRDDIETMGVKNSAIQIARNDGIAAWPAIVALAESPKRPGLLYAGTDDGRLAVSRDAGKSWGQLIDKVPALPKGIFVSEVVPSRFDEGTVYATFDGHRQDDFATYIYASADFGQTWRSIAANLQGEVARTLTEDLKNRDVLYLATETGLFVTIDRGKTWTRVKANLPTVRIDEIVLRLPSGERDRVLPKLDEFAELLS